MKTVILPEEEAARAVADLLAEKVRKDPEALIALPAGRTPEMLYRELVRRYEAGEIHFSRARFLLLTEFDPMDENDPRSCRRSLKERFLEKVDADPERCIFPSAENISTLDRQIEELGGIDLAVLGIGQNGHFAYNEPTTQFDAPSHRQKLSPGTQRSLRVRFGENADIPEFAFTVGIRPIVSAKTIAVMAFGKEKAGPVFKMLYARDDSLVPAAFLQIPRDVQVYIDEAAASEIQKKDGNT